MTNVDLCPFCEIVAGRAPATVIATWDDVIAIKPRGGVVDGHTLVIPHQHVTDFTDDPKVTGKTMQCAAELAADMGGAMNLITSKGREATQSVFHLHVHLLPRAANDGLALPWYSGKVSKEAGARNGARKRIADLHAPIQQMSQTWCSECSVRRSTGPKTEEWVAYIPHPCPTLEALDRREV